MKIEELFKSKVSEKLTSRSFAWEMKEQVRVLLSLYIGCHQEYTDTFGGVV